MTRQEEFRALMIAGKVEGVLYNAPEHIVLLRYEPRGVIHASPRWGAALIGKFGSAPAALEKFRKAQRNQSNIFAVLATLLEYTEEEVEDLECEALQPKK